MGGSRRFPIHNLEQVDELPSIGQSFVRDFRRFDDEQDESAARERNRSLDHVPPFLFAVHLLAGAAILFDLFRRDAALIGPGAAIALLVTLDLALSIVARRRPPSSLPSHYAVRFAALYAIAAPALWCVAAGFALAEVQSGRTMIDIAIAGGLLAIPIAFLSFPSLTLIGAFACAVKILLLSDDGGGAVTAALLSLCLVYLSVRRSHADAGQLRRRIAADWTAQRATRFIEEFEQAGRGWFWETTGRGAICYVSDHLAADLKTTAEDLIGRPFSEIIGADEAGESERTLGFHLSARLPSRTSPCAPIPARKSGGRCRGRRASTRTAAFSAFAGLAPISLSNDARRRRSTVSPSMIR